MHSLNVNQLEVFLAGNYRGKMEISKPSANLNQSSSVS